MIKKFIVYSLSFIVISLTIYHIPYTIYASEGSPSADIRAKLEELKKEIASKAAKLKLEVNRKLQNKAYAGIIKSISDQSITVATKSGPKIISINQDTVYESKLKSKTKFSAKTIASENYIAGLGDVDETGVLIAKKIVLLNPTPNTLNHKVFLWGQVISISDQLATIKDKDKKYVSVALPDLPTVKINDFVILTGIINSKQIFEADFAYILPQGAVLKPKKVATPSAQTASPSAKPVKKSN